MKRALLVGVDRHDNFTDLGGCVNDVNALEPLLGRNDDDTPNFDCQKRITNGGRVTRDRLLADLDALLGGGADVALLYFAGHGAGTGNDVALATEDGTGGTPGVAFSEVLTKVAESSVGEIIIILDCCFSGAAGGIPQLGVAATTLRTGVSILAASRGDQPSAETLTGRGVFSTFLEGALAGGAADVLGRVTVAGLYSYLDESFGAWDQRPAFKANVERLHELRRCAPAVPLDELRRIDEFFPNADHVFALDPSYEPDAEPKNPEHEAVFNILQKYRAAKLLEPVDAEHMYFAAMQSTGCRLTPLGRHYQHMSGEGRF
jgi:Caspase domain